MFFNESIKFSILQIIKICLTIPLLWVFSTHEGLPWWLSGRVHLSVQVLSLDWEDPLEKAMANHSSVLAWRLSPTKEPGKLQSVGSQRVR